MTTRRTVAASALALLAVAAVVWLRPGRGTPLPPGVSGAIAFVSDRESLPALYWRRLPHERTRRLTFGSEGVGEPAISPDGTRVAFSMGGRIGVVAVSSGETRVLTLGVDRRDAQPAWLPDGLRLVVSSRGRAGGPARLDLLDPAADGSVDRHPLTLPRADGDTSPTASPDGASVVFVREEHLLRVSLADGSTHRLTGGFRRERSPRFLPDGRVVCLWTEDKRHGIDVIDADGKDRRTLAEGPVFYRTIAPSRDGRFLAATRTYDVAFHPMEALLSRQAEEVRLLDADGRELATIEGSWWHASHSPDWGP
jgi:Tol biopolymer transport system component